MLYVYKVKVRLTYIVVHHFTVMFGQWMWNSGFRFLDNKNVSIEFNKETQKVCMFFFFIFIF